MVRNSIEDDVDELFRLPLSEFISARKTLGARLKKTGHADEALRVNALTKPPISAWTVNQLYWSHREEFDHLITAGERFRKAQTSRSSGKVADMRDALKARREALAKLSDLASTLMSDAGHNPTLEAIRRVTTTLEAMSAYALHPDGPTPGRLTNDVDPPGFESLASFIPGAGPKPRTESSTQVNIAKKSASAPTKKEKATQAAEASRLEKTRQAKIATAKVSLQAAKKSVKDAQAKVQRLEAAQKKADAESREAEKQRREAEQRYKRASIAAETATRRVQSMAEEVEEATNAFDDARRAVEEATSELELLFQVGP